MKYDKPRRTLWGHIIEFVAAIVALGLVTIWRKRFGEIVQVVALIFVVDFLYYRRQKQTVSGQDLSAPGTQGAATKK